MHYLPESKETTSSTQYSVNAKCSNSSAGWGGGGGIAMIPRNGILVSLLRSCWLPLLAECAQSQPMIKNAISYILKASDIWSLCALVFFTCLWTSNTMDKSRHDGRREAVVLGGLWFLNKATRIVSYEADGQSLLRKTGLKQLERRICANHTCQIDT